MVDLRGLYAVTDEGLIGADRFSETVAAAIAGGARLIQYRDKSRDLSRRRAQAMALRELCTAAGVPLIVNDDVELAAEVAADGVHLGRTDASLRAARGRLGSRSIIGISCYDSLQLARDGYEAGADYVAFGSVFASPTKPAATRVPLATLIEAKSRLGVPICAIGGITRRNAATLVTAGIDLLAVISDLFAAADVAAAAREFAALYLRAGDEARR